MATAEDFRKQVETFRILADALEDNNTAALLDTLSDDSPDNTRVKWQTALSLRTFATQLEKALGVQPVSL